MQEPNPCRECGNRNYHNRDCSSSSWERTGDDTIVRDEDREDDEPIVLTPAQQADLRERFAAFKANR